MSDIYYYLYISGAFFVLASIAQHAIFLPQYCGRKFKKKKKKRLYPEKTTAELSINHISKTKPNPIVLSTDAALWTV